MAAPNRVKSKISKYLFLYIFNCFEVITHNYNHSLCDKSIAIKNIDFQALSRHWYFSWLANQRYSVKIVNKQLKQKYMFLGISNISKHYSTSTTFSKKVVVVLWYLLSIDSKHHSTTTTFEQSYHLPKGGGCTMMLQSCSSQAS